MAIRLITGVPGAGKSYYIVDYIVKKYCRSFGDTYQLRKDYVIVTNVEGLLLSVVDLDHAIQKVGSLEQFFSKSTQKAVTEKYQKLNKKVIYIIDESQQYFHRRFYDREVFSFFESHRHYGLDIYLITQNSNLLAKDLTALIEFEIRAIPRTLSLGRRFNYLKKSNKDIIGREFLKKQKSIFNLYKSMSVKETEKIRTPYLKYLIPVVLLFTLGFYGLSQSFLGRSLTKSTNSFESDSSTSSISPPFATQPLLSLPYVPVSYVRYNSQGSIQLSVYNPISNSLMPLKLFPYPLRYIYSSKSLRLYAQIPREKTEN